MIICWWDSLSGWYLELHARGLNVDPQGCLPWLCASLDVLTESGVEINANGFYTRYHP